jgi:hypothetical protein
MSLCDLNIVILAIGQTSLEQSIRNNCAFNPELSPLLSLPKYLLPVGGKPALSWFYDHAINFTEGTVEIARNSQGPEDVGARLGAGITVLTDAYHYKAVERWAMFSGLGVRNIRNIGTVEAAKNGYIRLVIQSIVRILTSNFLPSRRNFITALDLALNLGILSENRRTLLISADLLFHGCSFAELGLDKPLFYTNANAEKEGCSPSYVLLGEKSVIGGLLETDFSNVEVRNFLPVAFNMPPFIIKQLPDFLSYIDTQSLPPNQDYYLALLQWIYSKNHSISPVMVPEADGRCPSWQWTCGPITFFEYLEQWKEFVPTPVIALLKPDVFRTVSSMSLDPNDDDMGPSSLPLTVRSNARVGLMGNPSDGFYGKTLSLLISNFWAEVTLIPNNAHAPKLSRGGPTPSVLTSASSSSSLSAPDFGLEDQTVTLIPNSICDPFVFQSLKVASKVCGRDGYYGVCRLFLATIRVFTSYCEARGVALRKLGFKVMYNTNIPRQVGLAGSSALITAFLRALILYNGLTENDIPPYIRANLALSAERDELSISAGQQDRVIQAYGGMVFMDFRADLMKSRGYGEYERIDLSLVPEGLWMAYVAQPSDSGAIHNDVRARFLKGDAEVCFNPLSLSLNDKCFLGC